MGSLKPYRTIAQISEMGTTPATPSRVSRASRTIRQMAAMDTSTASESESVGGPSTLPVAKLARYVAKNSSTPRAVCHDRLESKARVRLSLLCAFA